jgi:tetratricopeptide (TPR) repeat protein
MIDDCRLPIENRKLVPSAAEGLEIESEKVNDPFALHALGLIAYQKGQYEQAVELINKAIAANCSIPEFYNNIGLAFDEQGQYTAAIENYRRALKLKPDYVEAYNNLGITLRVRGEFTEAIECYRRAIQIRPDLAELYCNLADVYRDMGQCSEANANYDQAIQLKPDCYQAHWHKALALLLSGNFTEGWAEYKWRRHPDLKITTYPHHYLPELAWDGSSFKGKRLLVHYEQGLGDTLQFVRYLPMVKSRGGTVILEVRKPLFNLLQGFEGADELVMGSFEHKPDVKFDLHTSLMDLPCIFATTLETIPGKVPYIYSDPAKLRIWKERFAKHGFKIGIVWAGSSEHAKNHARSCPLRCFAPLTKIPHVRLYSLQKGPAAQQLKDFAAQTNVINIAAQLQDFADTAGVIANLDLVISVDTAVLHLAGAMGKAVWALLSYTPDWRWMLDRYDNPWYPTMRLFRQTKLGDWTTVQQRVADELSQYVNKRIELFSNT